MLVSLQHDDKWMAKGQFRLQNDHFPRKDWGELQNNTFLTEKSYHDCTLPAYRCRNVYCMSKTRTILFFYYSQIGVLQKLRRPAEIGIYSTWAHWLLREYFLGHLGKESNFCQLLQISGRTLQITSFCKEVFILLHRLHLGCFKS